jgi:hypothetical protein
MISALEQNVITKGGLCCVMGDSSKQLDVHITEYLLGKVTYDMLIFKMPIEMYYYYFS